MRGSIRRRTLKDDSVRFDARYRGAGGKTRERTFKRKKDAEAFLDKTATSVRDGTYVEVQPALMKDVFEKWLSDELEVRLSVGDRMKPATAASYMSIVRKHFIPAFGEYRSDQITAAVVARWRKRMARKVADGKLSKKTYNNAHNLLKLILGWARKPAQRFLKHDPLDGIERMRIGRSERRASEQDFLQPDEMAALLEAAATSAKENAVVYLGLFAGLRRGEIFALKWGDIDWGEDGNGGKDYVRRALSGGTVSNPKTSNSIRTVDLPRGVLDALAGHRDTSPPMGEGFVFRTAKGTPVDPDNWSKRSFAALRERAGLRSSIGLHSLRHTFASLLIDQNENVKYVSRQLGHASASFTLDTYAHIFEETSDKAMDRLQETIRATKRRRFQMVKGGRA